MRLPRLLISLVSAMVAASLLLTGCGGTSDSGAADTARQAASGASSAGQLPRFAFFTTGSRGVGEKNLLVRCALPDGPCTTMKEFEGTATAEQLITYSRGRVLFTSGVNGDGFFSCSATDAQGCVQFLPNSTYAANPLALTATSDGRALFSLWDKGLYSCDPVRTRSLADCRRLMDTNFTVLIPGEAGTFFGAVPIGDSAGRSIVQCRLGDGNCKTIGTVPGGASGLFYAPQFDRLYLGTRPSTFGPKEMWSCVVGGSAGCSRLNTFGEVPRTFTSDGTSVFAGTADRLMKCDPLKADRCSAVVSADDLGANALDMYGDRLLLGTFRYRTASAVGGLYLYPRDGGANTPIWHGKAGQDGGVSALTTDADDPSARLTTTLVRYTPKGSGVSASGRISFSPAPVDGDAECELGDRQGTISCISTFATGAKVTLTAIPGPSSAVNTWLGAARICNEPNGPGSPPATTCTITLAADADVTVGFRPKDTPTTPTTPGPPPAPQPVTPSGGDGGAPGP